MTLPLPLPAGLLTLRSLELYLGDLTIHSMNPDVAQRGYKFIRSSQVLYRIANLYRQLTGTDFERTRGKTREVLIFTPEQFELFATVVYRATIDGTSYEYNLRRELGLPDGSVTLRGEDHEGAALPTDLQSEVRALREEVAALQRDQVAAVGQPEGREVMELRAELAGLRDEVYQLRAAQADGLGKAQEVSLSQEWAEARALLAEHGQQLEQLHDLLRVSVEDGGEEGEDEEAGLRSEMLESVEQGQLLLARLFQLHLEHPELSYEVLEERVGLLE